MIINVGKQKVLYISLVVLLFAVGMIATTLVINQDTQANEYIQDDRYHNEQPAKYEINSDGLTFGSVLQASSRDDLPDLVAAAATNGEIGYVYTSELDNASPTPSNLDEAGKLMEERSARNSRLFVEFLSQELGTTINVDDSTALLAYEAADSFYSMHSPGEAWTLTKDRQEMRSDIIVALNLSKSALPDGEDLKYFLLRIMAKIQEHPSNNVEIPVYLEDGKTQIGVFLAGK